MGHGFRGAVTAWLALIALQAISTRDGSGRVASLFGDIDHLVQRALNPKVPAIPDRATARARASARDAGGAAMGNAAGGAAAAAVAALGGRNALPNTKIR
jgi:hypothetical protein